MRTEAAEKRVLVINHAFGLSGSVRSLGYVVTGLVRSGHEVIVVTKENDKGANFLREKGATVCCMGVSVGLSFSAAVEEDLLNPIEFVNFLKNFVKIPLGMFLTWYYIGKFRPSLLYLNEFVLVHCSVIGRLLGIPTIMHVRGPIIRGRWGIRRRLLVRAILKFDDRILAITETDARQLNCDYVTPSSEVPVGRSSSKVFVVPEFKYEDPIEMGDRSCRKDDFGLAKTRKVVTMLGGVSSIKGTLEFVAAARCLKENGVKDVVFVVAGPHNSHGSDLKPSRKSKRERRYGELVFDMIQRHDLSGDVKFLGEIRDVPGLLDCTDVLVFPSTFSHFGRPIIEAWSFEKPVIVSDTPHARELVENGVDGLIIAKHRAEELAAAIIRVLRDNDLAKLLGQNGLRKAHRLFEASTNIGKIVAICEEMISG